MHGFLMIETDETGQKLIKELILKIDQGDFTPWELEFIQGLKGKLYKYLTTRQKALVTELYEEIR